MGVSSPSSFRPRSWWWLEIPLSPWLVVPWLLRGLWLLQREEGLYLLVLLALMTAYGATATFAAATFGQAHRLGRLANGVEEAHRRRRRLLGGRALAFHLVALLVVLLLPATGSPLPFDAARWSSPTSHPVRWLPSGPNERERLLEDLIDEVLPSKGRLEVVELLEADVLGDMVVSELSEGQVLVIEFDEQERIRRTYIANK